MDEAKALSHMAITTMMAAMFLGIIVGLLSLGGLMWKSMAREEEANDRIRNYADYAAYDNKVVKGQDIVKLMEEHYDDIWVMVFNGPTDGSGKIVPGRTMNDMGQFTNPSPTISMYKQGYYSGNYIINAKTFTGNSNPTLKSLQDVLPGQVNGKSVQDYVSSIPNFKTITPSDTTSTNVLGNCYDLAASGNYTALQNLFLNNENLYRLDRLDDAGETVAYGVGTYAPFLSMLVYDNDNTTDVVGVIFVRESANVDPNAQN